MSGTANGRQRVDCGEHVEILVLGKSVLCNNRRLLDGGHTRFGVFDVTLNQGRVPGRTGELRHALVQLVAFTYSITRGVGVKFRTAVHRVHDDGHMAVFHVVSKKVRGWKTPREQK